MLLATYPGVPRIIFGISAWALCKLVMKSGRDEERTMLQRALRVGMICCMALHLLAILAILLIACPPECLNKEKLPSSPLTLHLEYFCQHMLRSIGILCLNVGLSITSEIETPNAMARQVVVYVYVALRTIGAILFHLSINTDLPMKVVCVETLLAIEAAVAGVVFIVLSVKFARIRRRLQESNITERSLVESILDAAADPSAIFVECFLMGGLLRIGEIVAFISPSSQLMEVMSVVINLLKIVYHALFTYAILLFLSMNVPTKDLERVGAVLRSLHCDDDVWFV